VRVASCSSGEPCSPGAAWAGTSTVVLQRAGHLAAAWLSRWLWFPVEPAESAGWCDLVLEWHVLRSAAAMQPGRWDGGCGSSGLGKPRAWYVAGVLRNTGHSHTARFLSSVSLLPELGGGLYLPGFPACKGSWVSKRICQGSLGPHTPTHVGSGTAQPGAWSPERQST